MRALRTVGGRATTGRLDVPIMIGAHLLLLALSLDGTIGRLDGLILFTGIVAYTIFAIRKGNKESPAVTAEYNAAYGKPKAGRSPRELALQAGLIVGDWCSVWWVHAGWWTTRSPWRGRGA